MRWLRVLSKCHPALPAAGCGDSDGVWPSGAWQPGPAEGLGDDDGSEGSKIYGLGRIHSFTFIIALLAFLVCPLDLWALRSCSLVPPPESDDGGPSSRTDSGALALRGRDGGRGGP